MAAFPDRLNQVRLPQNSQLLRNGSLPYSRDRFDMADTGRILGEDEQDLDPRGLADQSQDIRQYEHLNIRYIHIHEYIILSSRHDAIFPGHHFFITNVLFKQINE